MKDKNILPDNYFFETEFKKLEFEGSTGVLIKVTQ